MAQRRRTGGHAWVLLQYLLGFRRLGFDVLLLDRLTPEMCGRDPAANLAWVTSVLGPVGLGDCYSVDLGDGCTAGLSRADALDRLRSCAFLLNVMGFIDDDEMLAAAPLRAFLDIDPGFGQHWRALDLADIFAGHDRFLTVGTAVGSTGCGVPTCGLAWSPTLPPVVLERWPALPVPPGEPRFTSVVTWRGPFGPVDWQGVTLGLRVHEFRKFFPLPSLTGRAFELALSIDPTDVRDARLLRDHGWKLVNPLAVAGDPERYRAFVQESSAEFQVAKNMYVATRSGWFSDRSACYLASGRPVIAQDTGFSAVLPTGKGLLTFTTLTEAAAAVESVADDVRSHASAARSLAEEHLDSDLVLDALLRVVEA